MTSGITWFIYSISITVSAEVVVLRGVVRNGEFVGDRVEQTNTYLLADLLGCDNPGGLTALSGVTQLFITGI